MSASRSAATRRARPFACAASIGRAVVAQRAAAPRILHEHAEARPSDGRSVRVADDDLDAERLGARPHDVDRLRMAVGVDEEHVAGLRVEAVQHRHRLGRGGALVEQRRVGEVHAGEVRDHRLEVEQRFEPALGDLGLVRRVRGVPGRVLEHVAQDDGRRDRVVVAEPDQRGEHLVALARARAARRAPRSRDTARRARATLALADRPRDRGVDERVERRRSRARASIVACVPRRPDRCGGRRNRVMGPSGFGCGRYAARLRRSPSVAEPERFAAVLGALSPSVRTGDAGPALQSCLAPTVRVPERFRGGLLLRRPDLR